MQFRDAFPRLNRRRCTEMPDNNVATLSVRSGALIPRLHYGPPGPAVNFDAAIFAERDTGYVKEEDGRERREFIRRDCPRLQPEEQSRMVDDDGDREKEKLKREKGRRRRK
ncbi:unnamed protein product [Lasius platythorax]|uniref:Uncharacterized protein n=1 Tax=Lasius platythorax TaxID=488582 RepID=A0AAV2N8K8_9HYME